MGSQRPVPLVTKSAAHFRGSRNVFVRTDDQSYWMAAQHHHAQVRRSFSASAKVSRISLRYHPHWYIDARNPFRGTGNTPQPNPQEPGPAAMAARWSPVSSCRLSMTPEMAACPPASRKEARLRPKCPLRSTPHQVRTSKPRGHIHLRSSRHDRRTHIETCAPRQTEIRHESFSRF
jgi:hypothetical protein